MNRRRYDRDRRQMDEDPYWDRSGYEVYGYMGGDERNRYRDPHPRQHEPGRMYPDESLQGRYGHPRMDYRGSMNEYPGYSHQHEVWDVPPPRHRRYPDNFSWNPDGNRRHIGQDPRSDYYDRLALEDYGSRGATQSGVGGYHIPGYYNSEHYHDRDYDEELEGNDFGYSGGSPGYAGYSQNQWGGNRNDSYWYGNSRGFGGARVAGSGNTGRTGDGGYREETSYSDRSY